MATKQNTRRVRSKKFSATSFIATVAFLFLLVSMIMRVVGNRMELSVKQQELAAVEAQVLAQEADNEELRGLLSADELEMVERVAREEYDYAAPNERVFVDVSGK